VHGELLVLGVKVAASTVWETLHEAGIDRAATTWSDFLRSQAETLLACDLFETVTHRRAHCPTSAGETTRQPAASSGAMPAGPPRHTRPGSLDDGPVVPAQIIDKDAVRTRRPANSRDATERAR
jgi:hypothetical protein